MSKALSQQPEAPPESLLQFLKDHIPLDKYLPLNNEQIWYVASLFSEYMRCTVRGRRALMKELNVQEIPASYTKQYFIAGYTGDESKRLDPRKLIEFRGWFYEWNDNTGYHFTTQPGNKVEVYDRPELEACEQCNTMVPKAYCLAIVRDTVAGRDQMKTLCNHCRLYSNNPRVQEQGLQRTCSECLMTGCQFHPRRQAQQMPKTLYDLAGRPPEPPHPAETMAPPPKQLPGPWLGESFSRI